MSKCPQSEQEGAHGRATCFLREEGRVLGQTTLCGGMGTGLRTDSLSVAGVGGHRAED